MTKRFLIVVLEDEFHWIYPGDLVKLVGADLVCKVVGRAGNRYLLRHMP